MTTITQPRAIGASLDRRDGPQKVTGTAPYAYEHRFDNPLYLFPVQSDIAKGWVRIDGSRAEALPAWSPSSPTRTPPGWPIPATGNWQSCRPAKWPSAASTWPLWSPRHSKPPGTARAWSGL